MASELRERGCEDRGVFGPAEVDLYRITARSPDDPGVGAFLDGAGADDVALGEGLGGGGG